MISIFVRKAAYRFAAGLLAASVAVAADEAENRDAGVPAGRGARPTAAFLNVEDSPLGTLLEKRLLENCRTVWLERNRVDALLAEQKLQALAAADAGAQRIALGKILKADLLIVLRSERKKDAAFADLVVCETNRGLRLLTRRVPLSGKAEEDAAAMAALADRGIERFAAPIREVYAVPPLISKNLAYDYDYLRTSYARLIEQLLIEQPGVLVVELAEAEAIAREIGHMGETPARRLPLFVLGEYRHEGRGEQARVHVALRIRRGNKQVTETDETVPAAEVPDFLRRSVAAFGKAVGSTPALPAPGDHAVELGELVRQAREHQRMGDWTESLAMAEAALLLKPDQPDLHRDAVIVITELLKLLDYGGSWREYAPLVRCEQYYRRGLFHLEAAIRGGIDPRVGHTPDDFVSPFLFCHARHIEPGLPQDLRTLMKEAEQDRMETLLRLARFLAERGRAADSAYYVWEAVAHLDPGRRDAEILRVAISCPNVPVLQCWKYFSKSLRNSEFDTVEGRELLSKLGSSDQVGPATRAEAQSWLALIEPKPAIAPTVPRHRPAPLPLPRPVEIPAVSRQMAIVPVRINAILEHGRQEAPRYLRCIPAGEGVDFFWGDFQQLYLMKTKGQLRPIGPRVPGDLSQIDVTYDGRYVWVITPPQPVPRILVIDPASEQSWELPENAGLALPSVKDVPAKGFAEYRVLATPLAPGKVCIAAGFGRSWIATVSFDAAGHHDIRVFHEATEAQNAHDPEQWKKSTVSFRPAYMAALGGATSTAGKPARRILIGRGDSNYTPNFDLYYHPLLVDPENHSVEVVQDKLQLPAAQYAYPQRFAVHDGVLYVVRWESLAFKHWVVHRIALPELRPTPVFKVADDGVVAFAGDRLSVIGAKWWTGLLSDKELTCAGSVPFTLSPGGSMNATDRINQSNHYGLLVHYSPKGSGFSQVLLGAEAAAVADSQATEPSAPSPRMSAPRRAVERPKPSSQGLEAKYPLQDDQVEIARLFRPSAVRLGDRDRRPATLVMSQDGRYLAVNTLMGDTPVWSLKEKRIVRVFGANGLVRAFSPDGKLLATCGQQVIVWDVETGAEVLRTPVENPTAESAIFSPDGQFLIASSRHGSDVCNVRTGKLEYRTMIFGLPAGFLPDGSVVAPANDSLHTLIAWNLATRTARRLAEQALGSPLAVSPDGTRVAFAEVRQAGEDRLLPSHRLLVWDLVRQRLIAAIEPDDSIRVDAASFSADGMTLIALKGYGFFHPNEPASTRGGPRGLYRFSIAGERPEGGDISATPPSGSKPRTWTDASGQFSITAEFVDVALGKVTLRKVNGTTIHLPLKRLSERDQQYIRQHAK